MKRANGFTLVEMIIVIAIIAVIATIAIPGLLQAQRASYERSASTSLKTLASAEADFRSNDRDGNKVADFWTLDVAGLHTLNNWTDQTSTRDPLRLIELAVAAADADPNPNGVAGANYTDITEFGNHTYKSGYWYYALQSDLSVTPNQPYRTATNGLNHVDGAVDESAYNAWRFGFVAYPEAMATGKFAFVINETNTIFRQQISTTVRPPGSTPPGPPLDPPGLGQLTNYPTYAEVKSYWETMDK